MKEDVPETFREALETGRIGVWLKSQLIWMTFFVVGFAALWAYFKITGKV